MGHQAESAGGHQTAPSDAERRSGHSAPVRGRSPVSCSTLPPEHRHGLRLRRAPGAPFIVLERLPGGQTLADIIAGGPMPVSHVRSMLDDVLAGLGVAHAAGGVLHRDIKPGNILVSAPGDSMKVADFGIAKTAGAAHTMTGQIVGTMSYMSPERVAGGAPASVGDDLYAVGLMGYEALVGRRAFPQDNPAALAHAIMDSTPAPVAAVRSDVDPVLAAVIDRAIARNALQRFASAEHMRAALAGDQRALRGDAVSAGVSTGNQSP